MRRPILMVACFAALGACGSDNDPGTTPSPAGAAGEEAPDPKEQCPASFPAFATGASGLTSRNDAANVLVRLDKSSHTPPGKTFNDWRIVVTDGSGAALPNAQLTWACAWMDVHGHGTNPKKVESLGDGVFNLSQQNFSMFGPWQVRVWIDPTGKAPAYAPQTVSGVANGNACTPGNDLPPTPTARFDFCVPRSSD